MLNKIIEYLNSLGIIIDLDINSTNPILKKITEYLNSLGIVIDLDLNSTNPPIVLFASCILLLSLIALLCVIELIISIAILYAIDKYPLLDKFRNRPFLLKIIKFYSKTRLFYIITEFSILLYCLLSMIFLCSYLISKLMVKF